MMQENFLTQALFVYVGIDFGCLYALVAQHGLYGSQICTAGQEMSGEGVTQGMGTDFFMDVCFFCQFLDEVENHDASDIFNFAVNCNKDIVFVLWWNVPSVAVAEIIVQTVRGSLGDWDQSFFISFAEDFNKTFI